MRPKINHEQLPARFPKGTLARMDAVLLPKEKRSDFIRTAVEAEYVRRVALPASVEPGKARRGLASDLVRGQPVAPVVTDDVRVATSWLKRTFR